MNVAELIKDLQQLPQDSRVVVQGYEDGFDDVSAVMPVSIKPRTNKKWYYGKYDGVEDGEKAVLIYGRSRFQEE